MTKKGLSLVLVICLVTGCMLSEGDKPETQPWEEITLEEALATDVVSESADTLVSIVENGADEDSVLLLRCLHAKAALLSTHFVGKVSLGAHLKHCCEIYLSLIDSCDGRQSFSAGKERIHTALEHMEDPDALPEDTAPAQYWPVFPQSAEDNLYYALTACHMRAQYEHEQQEDIVSLTFGGDTTFGQWPQACEPYTFETEFVRRGQDYAFPLRLTAPYFANDSFSVLNCEGTFTESEHMREKAYCFQGPADYIQMFVNGHIEAVNLANNHTYDYFQQGYDDTKSNLERYGILYYGEQEYLVCEIQGITFGFFGYDLFSLEPDDMEERLTRDIAAVREMGAQVIIPTFHWGLEYWNETTQFQVDTAHLAVDLGADMVIGHHPHVLQGIENYKGKTIIYSLGNFAFGGDEELKDGGDTMVVRQTFCRTEEGIVPGDLMVIPANISTSPDYNNYVPRPLFDEEARRVSGRILDFSSRLEYGVTELCYLE